MDQNERLKKENEQLKTEIWKLKNKKSGKSISLGELLNVADFVKVRR